ncbi:phospho-sugar mutase [bacterium]|nr:phospho-sugar mutase [bacterium]
MTPQSTILPESLKSQLGEGFPRLALWLQDPTIEADSKSEILELINRGKTEELRERFWRELEFGTGGLRGVVGAGSNRMNGPIVRKATQGFANYILKQGTDQARRGVVIAYDSRLTSRYFSEQAAGVLAANGIPVYLFNEIQTTPCLSFSVRNLNCIGGLCITASHNPPQYNGYKVYWDDGAQITPPHDKAILSEVFAVTEYQQAKFIQVENAREQGLVKNVPEETVNEYFRKVKELQLEPNLKKDVSVVYTPLHGTGAAPTQRALNDWGYNNLYIVAEQAKPDGNFPTVKKPNPEEPLALQLAIAHAARRNADVVLATDPDSDRLALVVRDPMAAKGIFKNQAFGDYVFLNGNQSGALLIDYILSTRKRLGLLRPEHKVIKTIVTSDLHARICKKYDIEILDTLTGFKWIAGVVNDWERKGLKDHKYLFGTEESFGYMPGDYVRDKDGIGALCQAVEMSASFKESGTTHCQKLLSLFAEHGAWQEDLITVDLEGEEGARRIGRLMNKMRSTPLTTFAGTPITAIFDYQQQAKRTNKNGTFTAGEKHDALPKSDVIQLELNDGSKISMRPSGTEPKIKFYISVCTNLASTTAEQAYAQSVARVEIFRNAIHDYVASVE